MISAVSSVPQKAHKLFDPFSGFSALWCSSCSSPSLQLFPSKLTSTSSVSMASSTSSSVETRSQVFRPLLRTSAEKSKARFYPISLCPGSMMMAPLLIHASSALLWTVACR
ncbi:hypothetical protein Pyn_38982 [Prunus yedoensis var. nudiflora]|uniref:Uncharacterized protein n=1 Tax=Prunus yedoensis var. nudiflora TaxID=2094558 RepID=A0A315AJB4_PRUYE|nr:hypothetical protein Pyn_38982 [Prunus yedoensis var. nudiflora]